MRIIRIPNTASLLDSRYVNVTGDTMTGALSINVNSTTALLVEQDGVKDNTLVVDTTNGRVGINKAPTLGALDITGGVFSTAQNKIDGTADEIQFIVQANATQTANLAEWQNSSGTVLSGADSKGGLFSHLGTSGTNLFLGGGGTATATGTYNFGLGNNSLKLLSSGASNVGVGPTSLGGITTGIRNVAIGEAALQFGNTNYCIAIGGIAMGIGVVTGDGNIGIGSSSLARLTSGTYNIAIGNNSAVILNTGSANVYAGYRAGNNATSAGNNVAIGSDCGYGNSTGTDNVMVGEGISAYGTYASHNKNVIIGARAGGLLNTGSSNIFLGYRAGYRQTTNSNLLIVDNQQRADAATELTNSILYGVMAATPASQTLRINAVTTIGSTVAGALVIGVGTAGIDYNITFDGETNDGVLAWMEDEDYFQFNDDVFINDAENIVLGTTTGTKIGTATTQKLSFWNATPGTQPAGIADADGTLADITTKFNSLIGKLETLGLLATV